MRKVLSLKPSYYDALKRLTLELAGINLREGHEFIIETRLGAVARREGFESLDAMIEELFSTGQSRLAVQVVSSLLERDTHFYEDKDSFSVLTKTLIPAVLAQTGESTVRILSFGCSSGQEVYSLAMQLDKLKSNVPEINFEIMGVDYPSVALDRAKSGRYTHFEVQRGLPVSDLVRYFERKGEDWIVKKDLRESVSFKDVHLLSKLENLGSFDIVLFRNNLAHYSSPAQVRVLRGMMTVVKPEGFLMLGSKETLNQINYGFDAVSNITGVYRRQKPKPVAPPVDPNLKVPTGRKTFEKAKGAGPDLTFKNQGVG